MKIKPTKTGLIVVKRRLKLASKGYKLLKDKQDALISEFFKLLNDIKKIRITLSSEMSKAKKSMSIASALIGTNNIEQMANNLKKEFSFTISESNIMGVHAKQFTNIDFNTEKLSLLDSSLELEVAIKKFRTNFPNFIGLISKQVALNAIAKEIKRTKRKVNSLDNIIIPELKSVRKKIQFKLEEQERENFSRLKKIKMIAST